MNEILNDPLIDRPRKIFQLKSKLGDFIAVLKKMEDLNNDIFAKTDDDDFDAEIKSANDISETHQNTRDNIWFQMSELEKEEALARMPPIIPPVAPPIIPPVV